MKKFVSLLLTAVLLATMLTVFAVPASAAAQTIDGTDITWELTENDTKLIIGGEGEMPNFMFRDKTPWYDVADEITAIEINSGVTSIGNNAFNQCTSLKELTIPGSVVSIGNSAFQGCASLQTVTIPRSVVSIGLSAFANCTGIKTLTISDGVKSIGTEAFSGCDKIASVTIPGSVVSIGGHAFANCGQLTAVTISGSVVSIGEDPFADCNSNLVINGLYGSAADQYALENGVTFKGEGTCSHIFCLVCDSCHKSVTKSDLLQIWNSNGATASTLSEGSLTIIVGIAAAVVFGLGGFILGTKKKENEQSNA